MNIQKIIVFFLCISLHASQGSKNQVSKHPTRNQSYAGIAKLALGKEFVNDNGAYNAEDLKNISEEKKREIKKEEDKIRQKQLDESNNYDFYDSSCSHQDG